MKKRTGKTKLLQGVIAMSKTVGVLCLTALIGSVFGHITAGVFYISAAIMLIAQAVAMRKSSRDASTDGDEKEYECDDEYTSFPFDTELPDSSEQTAGVKRKDPRRHHRQRKGK